MSKENEFDEFGRGVPAPAEKGAKIRTSRLAAILSKQRTMRLVLGLPIVYSVLTMYLILIICVIVGWLSIANAKELAALVAVPATLAATVVGFFFGKTTRRK